MNYLIFTNLSLRGGWVARGKYVEWLEPDKLLIIEGWARDGLTDEQIAKNMGINVKTLYVWKNTHDPIRNALKKGKEVVDREVENALLKRALGYEYTEVKIEEEFGEVTKKTTTVKQVVPDTTAQIFWLKNRKPSEWRDKQNIEISKPIDESAKEMEEYFEQQKAKDSKSSVE